MDKTIKEFLEESIATEYFTPDTFVEIQSSDGEVLGFMTAEDLLDSQPDCIDLCYSESDKLDDGSIVVITE